METVTVSRRIDADPSAVRAAMDDLTTFMEAAGFDEVTVDGDRIHIENRVGMFGIELDLEVFDDGELAYRQRDGIFREMTTTYDLRELDGETEVSATTDFEVAAAFAGPLLDATVVKRQRRKELDAQFDYLQREAE